MSDLYRRPQASPIIYSMTSFLADYCKLAYQKPIPHFSGPFYFSSPTYKLYRIASDWSCLPSGIFGVGLGGKPLSSESKATQAAEPLAP